MLGTLCENKVNELKKRDFNKDKKQFVGKKNKWKLETIIRKSKTNIVKLQTDLLMQITMNKLQVMICLKMMKVKCQAYR